MQKIYLALLMMIAALPALFGQVQSYTLQVNGTTRTYWLHVPPGHDASVAAPLVLNFHGYTSNASQQVIYSNMNVVSDTAGFIVVYPEGLNASWNSFGFSPTPDDVAFTSAIIDDVNSRFKVDPAKVYACGMSNGGYMSHLLACELEGRIAAIASVTGLMAPPVMAQCNPARPVPMLQIHGTNDATVPYNGGGGIGSVDSTVQFWVATNGCPNGGPAIDTLPNTNTTDGSTAIRYHHAACDNGTKVTLIKMVNATHTWPNGAVNFTGWVTNRDFDGSEEIWRFFNSYTHPSPQAMDTTTAIKQAPDNGKLVKVYPNPMGSQLNIEVTDSRVKGVALYDVLGAKIYEANIGQLPAKLQFSTANLLPGVYFLRVQTNNGQTTYKLMK